MKTDKEMLTMSRVLASPKALSAPSLTHPTTSSKSGGQTNVIITIEFLKGIHLLAIHRFSIFEQDFTICPDFRPCQPKAEGTSMTLCYFVVVLLLF